MRIHSLKLLYNSSTSHMCILTIHFDNIMCNTSYNYHTSKPTAVFTSMMKGIIKGYNSHGYSKSKVIVQERWGLVTWD